MKVTQTPYSPYFVSNRIQANQPNIQINSGPRSGSLSSPNQVNNKFKDSSMQRTSNYMNNFQKQSSIIIHRPQSKFIQKVEQQYGISNLSKTSLPVTTQDLKNLNLQIEKMRKQIQKHSDQLKMLKSSKQPQTEKIQILLKEIESQYEKRFDVHMTSIMGTIIDIKKQIDQTVKQIKVNRQSTHINTQEVQKSINKSSKSLQKNFSQTKISLNCQVEEKMRREMQDRIKIYSNRLRSFLQSQIQKINSAINLIKIEQRLSIIKTSTKTQKKYLFNSIKLTYQQFLKCEKQSNLSQKKQYDYGYCWTPDKSQGASTIQSSGSSKERQDYFFKNNSKFLGKSSSYSKLSTNQDEVELSNQTINYFIDSKGYLLDQNNFYLTDAKGCMIQINEQMKEKLKTVGILKL